MSPISSDQLPPATGQAESAINWSRDHAFRQFVALLSKDLQVCDLQSYEISQVRAERHWPPNVQGPDAFKGSHLPRVVLWMGGSLDDEARDLCARIRAGLPRPVTIVVRHTSGNTLFDPAIDALLQQLPYREDFLAIETKGRILSNARFCQQKLVSIPTELGELPRDGIIEIRSSDRIPPLRHGLYLQEFSEATLDDQSRTKTPNGNHVVNAASIYQASPRGSLVNRLLDIERRYMALTCKADAMAEDIRRLNASASGNGQGGWFDVPRIEYPWPLSVDHRASTDPYDARCDDLVLIAGQQGEALFARFALTSSEPLFQDLIDHINNKSRDFLTLAKPYVSIVIPIYGQLAYTLNCLDSLFDHKSMYTFEIIVVDDCSPDESQMFLSQLTKIIYLRQKQNGGFIQSCNTGAAIAKGTYVLMLNNDTRVVDDWLDALIETFIRQPKAGLVGSKMLYSDGTLQEAGGIIWRDGSAWNYGRNDDPNRPQYCHARQVDYVSGCSIALPKVLWDILGGFDRHYVPAYCEDADLCLRIVDHGYEVWYQAQSRLIHYEGKTSGTDTKVGVKSYQLTNTKKLFARWKTRLLDHRRNAEFPFFERERKVRRRALLVDATAPTPNQDAGSVQTILGIRVFQALGYKAHFVPADNWLFQRPYTTDLQKEGVDCAYAPYELGFENYIRRYGWLFDVVMVYRITVLREIYDLIRKHAPQAVLLFHLADLHYLRMQRQAALEGDLAGLSAAERMKEVEMKFIQLSDCTITHSEHERNVLAEECPNSPVSVWPLMVDFVGTSAPFESRADLVFLGGYRHAPNIDAVLYFVGKILPLIRSVLPDVRFVIAGAHPPKEIVDLSEPGILVTGMVEDLRGIFDETRVFVCPLRIGAGAKGKVMSALAHGVPVVSTSVGIEGAGLEPGRHVLVADDPQIFAEQVCRVYRDSQLWKQISNASLELIKQSFSTRMGEDVLGRTLDRALNHKLGLVQTDFVSKNLEPASR